VYSKRIFEAYSILYDDAKRKKYDSELLAERTGRTTPAPETHGPSSPQAEHSSYESPGKHEKYNWYPKSKLSAANDGDTIGSSSQPSGNPWSHEKQDPIHTTPRQYRQPNHVSNHRYTRPGQNNSFESHEDTTTDHDSQPCGNPRNHQKPGGSRGTHNHTNPWHHQPKQHCPQFSAQHQSEALRQGIAQRIRNIQSRTRFNETPRLKSYLKSMETYLETLNKAERDYLISALRTQSSFLKRPRPPRKKRELADGFEIRRKEYVKQRTICCSKIGQVKERLREAEFEEQSILDRESAVRLAREVAKKRIGGYFETPTSARGPGERGGVCHSNMPKERSWRPKSPSPDENIWAGPRSSDDESASGYSNTASSTASSDDDYPSDVHSVYSHSFHPRTSTSPY